MQKLYKILLFLSLLFLTGCEDKKREEAISTVQNVICEKAEVEFTFNGLWSIKENNISDIDIKDMDNKFDTQLYAYREEDGSSLIIMTEDLKKTEEGSLLRIEDYVSSIVEGLKISGKYNYSCSDVSETVLYGKQYLTFRAEIEEINARQYYYVRRVENEMILFISTVYGESNIYDILDNGRKK